MSPTDPSKNPKVTGVLYEAVAQALPDSPVSEGELLHIFRLVTMGELSACFAHEIMNPLASLRGYVRLMEQVIPQDDPVRSQLAGLERNSKRIEDMAKTMLNFSRKRDRKAERCKVEDLVREAVRLVQPRFANPAVRVEVDIEANCPEVEVEGWQIVHALVNLLNNAGDALEDCPRRLVTIAVRYKEGFARISVADTGKGIPPADVNRVFHPFFTTKGEQGNGLGLYIARRTIEEHGGTITLQSGDTGTTFTICLPGR